MARIERSELRGGLARPARRSLILRVERQERDERLLGGYRRAFARLYQLATKRLRNNATLRDWLQILSEWEQTVRKAPLRKMPGPLTRTASPRAFLETLLSTKASHASCALGVPKQADVFNHAIVVQQNRKPNDSAARP